MGFGVLQSNLSCGPYNFKISLTDVAKCGNFEPAQRLESQQSMHRENFEKVQEYLKCSNQEKTGNK
jgi:hypothetical protein